MKFQVVITFESDTAKPAKLSELVRQELVRKMVDLQDDLPSISKVTVQAEPKP